MTLFQRDSLLRGVARSVSTLSLILAAAAPATEPDAIPPAMRRMERDIERSARRYGLGVRAGAALDPELLLASRRPPKSRFDVHSQSLAAAECGVCVRRGYEAFRRES